MQPSLNVILQLLNFLTLLQTKQTLEDLKAYKEFCYQLYLHTTYESIKHEQIKKMKGLMHNILALEIGHTYLHEINNPYYRDEKMYVIQNIENSYGWYNRVNHGGFSW